MLTPFATRKVCLEARPGQGEERGVGKEAVSQLKMKCSQASCFARVRRAGGEGAGGERRSEGSRGCAPAAPQSRVPAGAGPVCPASRGLPAGWGCVSLGGRPIVCRAPFNEVGTLAAFGTALSSTAAILAGA